MNIEMIEQQIEEIEEALPKIKAIVADVKVCSSDISKTILTSAIKKVSAPILEFKLTAE